mmetsp:Transcript_23283/g.64584  ORF Transcript_23283/g.64584 Transcript_23283/m.64584 type:complete len:1709 (-) Transcript_23283:1446-6572(-)
MRLGLRSLNRQCQLTVIDNDEQSTTSTSLAERDGQKRGRSQQEQQQQLPCEASSSSACSLSRSSSSSSLSDESVSIGVADDYGDDSSSSSSLPSTQQQMQQQHSQAFLTTNSRDGTEVLTANCDIGWDPPYETLPNSSLNGKDKSIGKSDNKNHSNSGVLIHRLTPQRQHKQHQRHSSSSKSGSEDEEDEDGSEDAIGKSGSQSPQHEYEQTRQQQQTIVGTLPQDWSQEHSMSAQNQFAEHIQERRQQLDSEPADSDDYESEGQQQPQRTGKQSFMGSNGSNKAGDGGDDDETIPDEEENGDETDIEDDDDDDGSDHEVPIWKAQDTQSVCEFTHIIRDYSAKRDSGCKKAEYSSTTVDNMGNKWRLIVYVNGNGRASNNHLSLFLQVADADDLPFGWKKAVSYVLTLEHPHSGAGLSYAKRNPDKTFKLCPKAIDWGWSQFITSDRIQQESFVNDDSLTVRASVTVKSSSVDIDIDDAELYLKCAVEEGRPDAVQLCLDQGASVNCQFKDDLYTPLHTACSTSPNEDGVNAALGSGGEHNKPNNSQSKNNSNAISTHEGSMKVLELLLQKGADGNACNKWRETPLLIAANNGHKAAVEALLKHGADPSLCSEAGWSALTFAAHKGYGDIVDLLLDDGAPVNCRVTEDSSTPLHKACAGSKPGHLEAVKLLLESNADVHALNKWRETPLLTAANHGQAGAVELLLRAGADPCKCTDTGWSPLSIAAYKGHDEVVKLLLEEGAPTEEADPTLSALLQAATKGLPDTVELLLQHGADHTVTTKKGDTALSILVEQNLIDAAVEMVTEYKASIPRCSRDRKKVQRARLLINLRLKQQQRENGSDDDDQVEPIPESGAEPTKAKSNRKKKKKKNTAEQQARAAEEALLLELEQEDAERHKLEQDANKKSAKKRKKKERERQLKKEQEERRKAEEKEEEERRKRIQDARDAAEREERERLAAAQRKEEEENRKKQEKAIRQQQQKEREQRKKLRKEEEERKKNLQQKERIAKNESSKNGASNGSQKHNEGEGQNQFPSTSLQKNAVTTKTNVVNGGNKRGWESLPVKSAKSIPSKPILNDGPKVKIQQASKQVSDAPRNFTENIIEDVNVIGNRVEPATSFVANHKQVRPLESNTANTGTYLSAEISSNMVSNSIHIAAVRIEPPAVSIFRREKISELLHRFSTAKSTSDPLGSVDLMVVKKVLFRWIMRAAHESSGYIDFIVPSWDDADKLATFFQRQFISETRKFFRNTNRSISMESLKEAGTATAHLCLSLANDVADFHRRFVDQLPPDWNDASIGVTLTEIPSNMGDSTVVINWSNMSRVNLPGTVFAKLKERYRGPKSQLLSSIFVCKTCYDTKLLLVEDTSMDYSLTPTARSSLAVELCVDTEVWSDPFLALSNNSFFGQFAEIDRMFGGLKPFGTNEDPLCQKGGSVSVLAPPDNMLATRYLHRMVDILESCDQANLPVSFTVFLRSECLVTQKPTPSRDDLYMLEPRLRDRADYISRVETLVEGAHYYFSEKLGSSQASTTTSLFVLLQNSLGRNRFPIRNIGILQILGSSEAGAKKINEPTLGGALTYTQNLTSQTDSSFMSDRRFLQPSAHLSASPTPPQTTISPDFAFGSIGAPVPPLSSAFVQDTTSSLRRAGPRRGRLFDLVDNGEEDTMNDVDLVSGLPVTFELFQNSPQDVDVEAWGIGEATPAFHPRSNKTQGRFG